MEKAMSMIERVARALCAKVDGNNPNRMLRTSPVIVYEWEMYKDDAVIAIEAMRDPTPEMERGLQAYFRYLTAYDEPSCETAYRVMIDAALKERG